MRKPASHVQTVFTQCHFITVNITRFLVIVIAKRQYEPKHVKDKKFANFMKQLSYKKF